MDWLGRVLRGVTMLSMPFNMSVISLKTSEASAAAAAGLGGCEGDDVGGLVSSAERRAEVDSEAPRPCRIDWRHDEQIEGLSSRDNDVPGAMVMCN